MPVGSGGSEPGGAASEGGMMAELLHKLDALQRDVSTLSQIVHRSESQRLRGSRRTIGDEGQVEQQEEQGEGEGYFDAEGGSEPLDDWEPEQPGHPGDDDDEDDEPNFPALGMQGNGLGKGNRGSRNPPSQFSKQRQSPSRGPRSKEERPSPTPKYNPLDKALKFYSIQLKGVQVSQAGDTSFPYAKDTWLNCLREYPVRPIEEKALIGVNRVPSEANLLHWGRG